MFLPGGQHSVSPQEAVSELPGDSVGRVDIRLGGQATAAVSIAGRVQQPTRDAGTLGAR